MTSAHPAPRGGDSNLSRRETSKAGRQAIDTRSSHRGSKRLRGLALSSQVTLRVSRGRARVAGQRHDQRAHLRGRCRRSWRPPQPSWVAWQRVPLQSRHPVYVRIYPPSSLSGISLAAPKTGKESSVDLTSDLTILDCVY